MPTLMYASESSSLRISDKHKLNVIWNNIFRHIFRCC